MQLSEYLSPDAVLVDLRTSSRDDTLAALVQPLSLVEPAVSVNNMLDTLQKREQIGSTAVGSGVAIPHGKVSGLSRVRLSVGRSRAGIPFDPAKPNELCHIFFCVLTPPEEIGTHLLLLAQLARRAKEPVFRSDFMLAHDVKELWLTVTAP